MDEAKRIETSLRGWTIALGLVFVTLCVAGVVAEHARYMLHSDSPLVDYFSLTEEKNVPTWWSSLLLVACSAILALIAATKRRGPGQFKGHWVVLSAIFCYMSIDELVEIHEWLNSLKSVDHRHGILYYGWVIPAGAIVIVFALSYLRFLFHLPPKTRNQVALAGVIFVGGAIGIELLLGVWTDVHGENNFTWALIGAVEEAMEMLGSSLFLLALLRYLGSSPLEIHIDGR